MTIVVTMKPSGLRLLWINARGGYTKLSIPNGEFIVGKQWTPAPGTGGFVEYSIPFKLVNCTEVELAGTGHPVIRFEDCLKYGRFVMVGGVVHAKVNVACNNSTLNWTEVAEVGAMIHLDNCSKTTIKQLKLDGNINGAIIGGKYNYDGYQIGYDGLIAASCDNIKIANVRVSHFGRDGMMLCSSDAPAMNIAITNSWFNFNCRTGMSWGGGNGLTISGSQFNYNGIGRIVSAMASGFDAELEPPNAVCTSPSMVANGTFTNCEFSGNRFCGFITDQASASTKNISFSNCTFRPSADPSSYCSWQRSKAVQFKDCTFYGRVGPFYNASVTAWPPSGPDYRTVFSSCNFYEEDANYCYVSDAVPASCEYFPNLLESDYLAGRVVFEQSNFTVNCNARIWLRGRTNAGCTGCPTHANAIDMIRCNVRSNGREYCPLPAPEEPFTFHLINMNGTPNTVQAPSAVRPPGAGSYYWGPGTTYNGSFSYSTFAVPPYAPCKPLYTDPPTTPATTCGQPAPVPIPYCADETINIGPRPGGVEALISVTPQAGLLHITDHEGVLQDREMPYELTDSAGHRLGEGLLLPGTHAIPDPGLSSGTYILYFHGTGRFAWFVITSAP